MPRPPQVQQPDHGVGLDPRPDPRDQVADVFEADRRRRPARRGQRADLGMLLVDRVVPAGVEPERDRLGQRVVGDEGDLKELDVHASVPFHRLALDPLAGADELLAGGDQLGVGPAHAVAADEQRGQRDPAEQRGDGRRAATKGSGWDAGEADEAPAGGVAEDRLGDRATNRRDADHAIGGAVVAGGKGGGSCQVPTEPGEEPADRGFAHGRSLAAVP